MQRKRRPRPAPPVTAPRVAESPETTASEPVAGSSGVRYDPDELFPDSKRLSVREREALELLADGKPNGVIASVMKNSKRTVENHISKVLSKLNVADRNRRFRHQHLRPAQWRFWRFALVTLTAPVMERAR
jgi:DNA-binding NarL/FixJ family response regulator